MSVSQLYPNLCQSTEMGFLLHVVFHGSVVIIMDLIDSFIVDLKENIVHVLVHDLSFLRHSNSWLCDFGHNYDSCSWLVLVEHNWKNLRDACNP